MLIPKLLFAPVDTTTDTGGKDLSVDDIYDALGPDKEKDEIELSPLDEKVGDNDLLAENEKEKEDKKKDKKDEKEEELELEDEPKDIDELESVGDVPRKEILAKYPTIFKEFPQLERAYYIERKYAELLPTLDDAKVAVEKSETYDRFEQQLLEGNLDTIISSVKTADSKVFNKMVDNYLPILSKVDQNAYFHVIGGVIKQTIAGMVQEGNRLQNDDLKAAAVLLNQYIFGKSEYEPPRKFGPERTEDTEAQDKLKAERNQFVKEKFETTLDDLETRSSNIIKSTISNHIDPKGVMTEYVKRTAVRDAVDSVEELITNDARFKSVLDKLWEKAFAKNFHRDSLKDIERAYLNKAKSLLPSVIQKHRNEALRGLGKRVTEEKEEPVKRGPVAVGRSATANNSGNKAKGPGKMSTLEFLNSDD